MTDTAPPPPSEPPEPSEQPQWPELPLVIQPKSMIPYSWWAPFVAGIAGGMLLRFLFSGAAGSNWSPMAGAFIYLSPWSSVR